MKIAYDAKRFFNNTSGLGNYSRDLIRIIATHYPDHQYILLNNKDSERVKEILAFKNVSFVKTSNGKFSRQLKMGKNAQELNADIFHGLSGELPLKWSKKPIIKIVTIHDLIFERFPEYYSWFDRKIHYWKFKKAAEIADVIIAISEQTKKDIVHFLKVPEDKIKVVYQGCHQAFKEKYSAEELFKIKQKYQLPERFVLNVGTIEERKNLLQLIKSLKDSEIPLVVVGKKQKTYFAKIQKFLKKNSVKVQFLNNVSMEELAKIYQLADLFVYPSKFEGFGIPIIEAHFSGTPVITGNVSSLPEAGGENALYVNPNDVADIRSKILFLWHNEAERNRRREKSFAFVQKFRDEIVAGELMKVYKESLAQ